MSLILFTLIYPHSHMKLWSSHSKEYKFVNLVYILYSSMDRLHICFQLCLEEQVELINVLINLLKVVYDSYKIAGTHRQWDQELLEYPHQKEAPHDGNRSGHSSTTHRSRYTVEFTQPSNRHEWIESRQHHKPLRKCIEATSRCRTPNEDAPYKKPDSSNQCRSSINKC